MTAPALLAGAVPAAPLPAPVAPAAQGVSEPVEQQPVAWRADWPNWRQWHDETDPLPATCHCEVPTITPLFTHPKKGGDAVLQDLILCVQTWQYDKDCPAKVVAYLRAALAASDAATKKQQCSGRYGCTCPLHYRMPDTRHDAAVALLKRIRFHAERHSLPREWLTAADEVLGTWETPKFTHAEIVRRSSATPSTPEGQP